MKWESTPIMERRHLSLQERIAMAKEHIARHGGGDHSLWPFQNFSMTINELLEAAETEKER